MTDSTSAGAVDRERLIRELLARRGVGTTRSTPAVPVRAAGARVPLSSLQEGIWFLDRLAPGGAAYLISTAARLTGALDAAVFATAVETVVARHEALRTAIVADANGRAEQVVLPADDPACRGLLAFDDLSDDPDPQSRAALLRDRDAETGFDLGAAPLLRARLIRLGPDSHLFVLVLHHIIADERSLQIVLGEILDSHHRLVTGQAPLPPVAVQYPDHVLRHHESSAAGLDRQRAYWEQQLAGISGLLALPLDRPRPAAPAFVGATLPFRLDAELSAAVGALARSTGCTLFMITMAALKIALRHWTGEDDLCVGSPVTTRATPALQSVVGLMVNSLPLRTDLSADPTLATVLDRVRRTCVDAMSNVDVPLEQLVGLAGAPRDPGLNPLFQVMCVVAPPQAGGVQDGLTATPVGIGRRTARLDLTLVLFETRPELVGGIDYRTDLFDEATVARFAERFTLALRALTGDRDRRLSELELTGPVERAELAGWQGPARDHPVDRGLHELISATARAHPDHTAVRDEQGALTYRELDARARRLAYRLRAAGVGPEVPVGLVLPSGRAAVVGILAVLHAGGAYLPLDPGSPPQRLAALLADAGAPLVLTDPAHAGRLGAYRGELIVLTPDGHSADGAQVDPVPLPACHPAQAAYVVYTSGSTGRPKGVVVPHRNAVNLTCSFIEAHTLTPADRLLMLPPLSFDASVGDLFPALVSGATLVLHPRPAELTGPELLRFAAAEQITLVDTAAALWARWTADLEAEAVAGSAGRHLDPAAADGGACVDTGRLRGVMIGGEAAPTATVRSWARLTGGRVPLYNHYGPTEGTVCATTYRTRDGAEPAGAHQLPIGTPLPNVTVHLLDSAGRPVPVGATGEVHLGGAAPARGYLGAAALTAERFVPDPFGAPGARLYRTGDLARRRSDGTLDFLGRTDRQVKIRGHRIEVGEIEAACLEQPEISRALVTVHDDGSGARLVAYLVPVPEATVGAAEVRVALRRRLPAHLVPAGYALLPELPLNRHGKVDERALPPPAYDAGGEHLPPATGTERVLAGIWAALLPGGPRDGAAIGRRDSFFDLGGHSLLAGPLTTRITEALGVRLPVRALFDTPDLATMAAAIDAAGAAGGSGAAGPARSGASTAPGVRDDAMLPDDVCAALPTAAPAAEAQSVLLTGATGFLGAHLLADWLTHSDAVLHCLVRAGSAQAALDRVRANLTRYGRWDDRWADRLVGVPGDLGSPRLGLSVRDFAELADSVDAVVHNGGLVNFLAPYERLRAANVGGTLEVLRLAGSGRPTALHVVSTLGVFLTPDRTAAVVRETDSPDDCTGLGDGYNAAKWAADALARAARDRGLAVTVHRPARITGHALTGTGNADDYFTRLLRSFVGLGAVPELTDDPLDLAPVDHVAAGIGHLSRSARHWGRDFHFYNNRTISFAELAEALRTYGFPVRLSPYPQWRAALLNRPDLPLAPFTPLFGPQAPPRTQPTFDCTATEAALAPAGLVCPPADARLIHTYLDWCVRAGLLDRPPARVPRPRTPEPR